MLVRSRLVLQMEGFKRSLPYETSAFVMGAEAWVSWEGLEAGMLPKACFPMTTKHVVEEKKRTCM